MEMKKWLLGVGAVTAAVFAVKKLIDNEVEREYVSKLEKDWEEEANFKTSRDTTEYEEEVEEIFAESENVDITQGLWEQTKTTVMNVLEVLPRVRVNISIERPSKKEEE